LEWAEFNKGKFPMRNKQNPEKIMNPNINLEQIDAKPFEESR